MTRAAAPTALSGNIDPSTATGTGVTGLNGPRGFAFNDAGSRVYICNNNGNTVTVCDVQNFQISNCRNSGATVLDGPRGIAFYNGYALVLNGFGDGLLLVVKCLVNATDGSLSGCGSAGNPGLWQPWSIQMTTEHGGNFVYIANRASGNVRKCTVSATATLSSCVGYSSG